jgi:Mn2+/Fe2+ NRAMP family transporter
MFNWIKNIGPGTLVAAAFIGPGTVTICTIAGASFGFSLLWALTLSIIATIVLQEMAARVGIITQKGLAEVIKNEINSKWLRNLAILLILSAIVIGNAAYEAGNISGASLGVNAIFPNLQSGIPQIIIGVVAFILLFIGNYKVLERSLVVLVLIMSFSFIITAIITKPSFAEILKGMFIPTIPKNSILTIIGLIGTTVVPYNLFLHASLVKEKWTKTQDLKKAKIDTVVSIILGGIVSMCIIISASAMMNSDVKSVLDLSEGLEPLFGNSAKYFLGVGLFAAGITSSITAPLAAAYVVKSCFGWKNNLKSLKFRLVWMFILVIGVLFSSIKLNPIEIIKFAQITNGLLLPIVAIFLWWIVNKTSVLGIYKNKLSTNIITGFIIIITIVLGLKSILKVLELM